MRTKRLTLKMACVFLGYTRCEALMVALVI